MAMLKYSKLLFSILISVLLLSSCSDYSRKGPKIDESKLQKTDIKIHRYGKSLFEIDTNEFEKGVSEIHDEFILFLGSDIGNPAKLAPLYAYVTDTSLISIANFTLNEYPELTQLELQLSNAISRYQYFFPDYKIPTVYSYISNLYYEKPIIIDDSVILIALDVYLGEDYPTYRTLGLPFYIIRRMTSDNIAIDVMKELYNTELEPSIKQKTLIDRMVDNGKILYYLDALLPSVPDSLKIGYSEQQINWIESNKENVWAFLVNNALFYSADFKIQSNFMKEAPFSSIFSQDSPPRIGQWLGWQIVRRYMERNPEISLQTLIDEKDFQKIFNESGYKP